MWALPGGPFPGGYQTSTLSLGEVRMKAMSLEEAVATIRAKPPAERAAAIEALAAAANRDIAEGPVAGWAVFDPLECTQDTAARCDYRGGPGSGRICLVAIDEGVECPHAEYVP